MVFQRAFAKINLGLRVVRKREDGYHDLETVFHRVDLFDDLSALRAPELSLSCDDPELAGDDNLALVAARALRERFDVKDGARISLKKRIPHGAGLGGGSSDAASALRVLSRLWGLHPTHDELASIALSVGSDVPFFLGDRSAHAVSRGERLEWFDLVLPCTIVVVFPAIRVSTREAFGSVVPRSRESAESLKDIVLRGASEPLRMRGAVENDFEGPIFKAHPSIAAIRDHLYEGGAGFAQMSGSGSSVFGLFSGERQASRAAGSLSSDHRVVVTPPGFIPDLSIGERPD